MNYSLGSVCVGSRELVIFDANVDNIQQLIEGLKPGIDWAALNPNQDGIEQITQILTNRAPVETLHIVSHGVPGCLFLGNTQLSLDTLKGYTAQLQSWLASDILLYGCNVAAGDAGVEFLAKIQALTKANIAASANLTGNDALGGDWELEVSIGNVKAEVAFLPKTQVTYASVLSSPVHLDVSHIFNKDGIVNDYYGKDNYQDGIDQDGRNLITQSFANSSGGGQGLPDNGFFPANSYHPNIQLQYRNSNDGDNLRQITSSTGSFNFSVSYEQFSEVHIAALSTQGSSDVRLTFSYNDATSVTTSSAEVPDWFDDISQTSYRYYLIDGMDRAHSNNTLDDTNDPALFGLKFNNPYPSKGVHNIKVEKTGGSGYFSFLGATGVVAELTPSDISLSKTSIAENSANGTEIGVLSTTDPNYNDSHTYTLLNNAGGRFDINSNRIIVKDGSLLDYESANNHTIQVRTTDSTGRTRDESFTISLTNVNEAPTSINVDNSNVDENATDGTTIATLSTIDPDSVDSYTYTLVNDAEGRFGISGSQLVVADGSLLDHETADDHIIQLRTTDSGGLTHEQDFQIIVDDVNEAPEITNQTFSVAENATNRTVVGTVTSSDVDGSDVTYSITAGNDNGIFAIDADTGEISVNDRSQLDYETVNSHDLTIEVSDGEYQANATVEVGINNINEAPEISNQSFSIAEDATNGTTVGTVTSSDVDGPTRTYSITAGNDDGIFNINEVSGEITIADDSLLDFETTDSYDLTVEVSDGEFQPNATITVSITDANDAPEIEDQTLTLAEDATNGSSVGTVTVNDADGDNLIYSITAGNNDGIFEIDENTGEITLADSSQIDFETTESYDLTVKVDDGEYQASATVTVDITDVNEVPEFTSTAPVNATQDAAYSYNIVVADPDAGDNLNITAPALPDWLTLTDNGDGTATLSGTPGNADIGDHSVELQVEDSQGDIDTQSFTVKVKNTNDAPTITGTPNTTIDEDSNYSFIPTAEDIDGDVLSFSIQNKPDWADFDSATGELSGTPENESVGITDNIIISATDGTETVELDPFSLAVVNINDIPEITSTAPVTATQSSAYTYNLVVNDPDTGDNLTITAPTLPDWLTLSDNGDGTATLSGTPGNAEVGDHAVELQVEDSQGDIDTQSFTVKVKNTNDAPTIAGTPNTTVDEDSNYSFVPTAEDLDGDSLSFSIQNQPTWSLFDSATGELSGMPENADVGTTNNIVISVSDGTATVAVDTFSIEVINTNDAPEITSVAPTNTAQSSSYTYNVVVNDPDIGENLTITAPTLPDWLTLSDNGDGTATLAGQPDNEHVGNHAVELQVEDSEGEVKTQNFTVTVNDVNDAPTITGTPETTVDEDSNYSFVPTTDDLDGDSLSFSIQNKPRWATFNSATGKLSGTPSNQDVGITENIVISVSDGTKAVALNTFNLEVVNTNDAPEISNQRFTVAENLLNIQAPQVSQGAADPTRREYQLGKVIASDVDGDSLTYKIIAGNEDGVFAISESTGEITIPDPDKLDFETTPSYSLTVETRDSETEASATVTIDVTNANESPTQITLDNPTIAENSPHNTLVGTLSTIDPDGSGSFTYKLLENAGGRFKLSGNKIFVDESSFLDYEDKSSLDDIDATKYLSEGLRENISPEHKIKVRATDSDGLTHEEEILIEVEDSIIESTRELKQFLDGHYILGLPRIALEVFFEALELEETNPNTDPTVDLEFNFKNDEITLTAEEDWLPMLGQLFTRIGETPSLKEYSQFSELLQTVEVLQQSLKVSSKPIDKVENAVENAIDRVDGAINTVTEAASKAGEFLKNNQLIKVKPALAISHLKDDPVYKLLLTFEIPNNIDFLIKALTDTGISNLIDIGFKIPQEALEYDTEIGAGEAYNSIIEHGLQASLQFLKDHMGIEEITLEAAFNTAGELSLSSYMPMDASLFKFNEGKIEIYEPFQQLLSAYESMLAEDLPIQESSSESILDFTRYVPLPLSSIAEEADKLSKEVVILKEKLASNGQAGDDNEQFLEIIKHLGSLEQKLSQLQIDISSTPLEIEQSLKHHPRLKYDLQLIAEDTVLLATAAQRIASQAIKTVDPNDKAWTEFINNDEAWTEFINIENTLWKSIAEKGLKLHEEAQKLQKGLTVVQEQNVDILEASSKILDSTREILQPLSSDILLTLSSIKEDIKTLKEEARTLKEKLKSEEQQGESNEQLRERVKQLESVEQQSNQLSLKQELEDSLKLEEFVYNLFKKPEYKEELELIGQEITLLVETVKNIAGKRDELWTEFLEDPLWQSISEKATKLYEEVEKLQNGLEVVQGQITNQILPIASQVVDSAVDSAVDFAVSSVISSFNQYFDGFEVKASGVDMFLGLSGIYNPLSSSSNENNSNNSSSNKNNSNESDSDDNPELGFTITNKVKLKNYDPFVEGEPELEAQVLMTFGLDSGLGLTSGLGFKLAPDEVWKTPFGIPDTELRKAGIEFLIDPTKVKETLGIKRLNVIGDLKFGDYNVDLATSINVDKPEESALVLTAHEPISLFDLMVDMHTAGIGSYTIKRLGKEFEFIEDVFNFLDNLVGTEVVSVDRDNDGDLDPLLKIVQAPTWIVGDLYQPGFEINAKYSRNGADAILRDFGLENRESVTWGADAILKVKGNPFNENSPSQNSRKLSASIEVPEINFGFMKLGGVPDSDSNISEGDPPPSLDLEFRRNSGNQQPIINQTSSLLSDDTDAYEEYSKKNHKFYLAGDGRLEILGREVGQVDFEVNPTFISIKEFDLNFGYGTFDVDEFKIDSTDLSTSGHGRLDFLGHKVGEVDFKVTPTSININNFDLDLGFVTLYVNEFNVNPTSLSTSGYGRLEILGDKVAANFEVTPTSISIKEFDLTLLDSVTLDVNEFNVNPTSLSTSGYGRLYFLGHEVAKANFEVTPASFNIKEFDLDLGVVAFDIDDVKINSNNSTTSGSGEVFVLGEGTLTREFQVKDNNIDISSYLGYSILGVGVGVNTDVSVGLIDNSLELDANFLGLNQRLYIDIDSYATGPASIYGWVEDYVMDELRAIARAKEVAKKVYNFGKKVFGKVFNSYIEDAEIFFDANLNGIRDINEPFTMTEADGSYEFPISWEEYDLNGNGIIDPTEGLIVAQGGTYVSSGLPLEAPLTAVPGSEVVTPLTTLAAELAVLLEIEPEVAEFQVKSALGLPEEIDLGTFNYLDAIANGDPNGLKAYAASIQVQNTLVTITKALEGAVPESAVSVSKLAAAAMGGYAIASRVTEGQSFDLSQPETLQIILESTLDAASDEDAAIDPEQLSELSEIIVQAVTTSNQQIQEVALSEGDLTELAIDITQIEKVALGDIAESLSQLAAGTKTLEAFVAETTPEAIEAKIAETIVSDPTFRPEVIRDDSEDNTVEDTTENTSGSNRTGSANLQFIGSVIGSESDSVSQTSGFNLSASIPQIITPVLPVMAEMTANVAEATAESDMMMGNGTDPMYLLEGNDTLMADDQDNWVNGNQGNDMIDVGAGNDTLYGGKDNDTAFGSADSDWMNGNKGADFLDGGEGADTIFGGQELDTVFGAEGNDWLSGNLGADFLNGGEAADTIFGGQEGDSLQGGADNDELSGNVGADLMEGNEGDDILYGGQDSDTVSGNDGNDILNGDRGNDLLDGNAGNDIINGGQGDDTLDGGEGNDELIGGIGNDLLFGAGGADTLTGGEGIDQFVITPTSGSNIITDFTDGEDMIVLEDGLTFEQLTIEASQTNTIVKFNNDILATLNGVESSLITAEDFNMGVM
ncbi:MAG: cadherin domain-containing protein [Microcoleaceae cyanobacterium]